MASDTEWMTSKQEVMRSPFYKARNILAALLERRSGTGFVVTEIRQNMPPNTARMLGGTIPVTCGLQAERSL